MANSHSYRFGPQRQLVQGAVDSSTVIEVGDMLYLATDDVRPAGQIAWNTNLATTQADFAAVFLGIAAGQSASGDTDPVDIDVSPMSVYEFTVASATYELGDPLGPDKASGNALLDAALEGAVNTSSVARAYERKTAASTLLMVTFASAYNAASANTNATLG